MNRISNHLETTKDEETYRKLRLTVEQADKMSSRCERHKFYLKEINGETWMVYAERQNNGTYNIECFDVMREVKNG